MDQCGHVPDPGADLTDPAAKVGSNPAELPGIIPGSRLHDLQGLGARQVRGLRRRVAHVPSMSCAEYSRWTFGKCIFSPAGASETSPPATIGMHLAADPPKPIPMGTRMLRARRADLSR